MIMHGLSTIRRLNDRAVERCVRCGVTRQFIEARRKFLQSHPSLSIEGLLCTDCACVLSEEQSGVDTQALELGTAPVPTAQDVVDVVTAWAGEDVGELARPVASPGVRDLADAALWSAQAGVHHHYTASAEQILADFRAARRRNEVA